MSTTAIKPVLEVRNLSVTLPKGADREFAVEKVNFTVNPGEIVCLVGESGSGKSVIAFTVMGRYRIWVPGLVPLGTAWLLGLLAFVWPRPKHRAEATEIAVPPPAP